MTSTGTRAFTLPHDPLTPLDPTDPPTALTLSLLCRQLYANAQSIESKLGGGEHGHLGMLMPDDEYCALSANGEPYVHPVKPVVPNYTGTAANQKKQEDEYKEATEAYTEKRTLQNQLQQLILQAVPDIYIEALADHRRGFADVTPMSLLDHLVDTYGTITDNDLANNLAQIQKPWNPDTPIETVFANGNKCRRLADDGQDPITDKAYIRILVSTFKQSGVLDKAIEDWELKKPTAQTLQAAIKHFTKMDKYRRDSKVCLKEILSTHQAIITPPRETSPRTPQRSPPSGTLDGWHYCWTHGVATHSGANCLYPAEGHVPDATLTDPKGGSDLIQRRRSGSHKGRNSRKQAPKRKATDTSSAPATSGGR